MINSLGEIEVCLRSARRFQVFSWLMGGPIGRTMAYLFNGVARFFFTKGFVHRPEKEVMEMYLAPFRRRADRRQTSISPRPWRSAAPNW